MRSGSAEATSNVATHAGLAVIGAGAAGLAAAIFAADAQAGAGLPERVVLLDGAPRLGAKILVSGGGRCNVTHEAVTARDFFGDQRVIRDVLAALPVERTVAWFRSMGVELKREETGKLFPVTDKARTVLEALVRRAHALNVDLRLDHRVSEIHPREAGFVIRHAHGTLESSRVILATGGRSLPRTGSDGFGYRLARALGHEVTTTVPALVPLLLEPGMFHASLSGLSQPVQVTTRIDGRQVDSRRGSLLWTHFGVSGPVVMDASRFWTLAAERGETADLFVNFLPGRSREQVLDWFRAEATVHPRRSVVRTLATLVPERFAEALCRHVSCETGVATAQVRREMRARICESLTAFPLPVRGHRGWNHAEVTAGGVPLDEIDARTMESKRRPGLYVVGELLDCDGRIGGFNFQWAWATGFLAGRAAVRRQNRGA